MAAINLFTVALALFLTPLVYLLLKLIEFVRTTRSLSKCVRQWPGQPLHWLLGNLPQHPLFQMNKDNMDTMGSKNMQWLLDCLKEFPRGYYFFYSSWVPSFQANHPDLARVLVQHRDPKPLSGAGYNLMMPWLGDGLLITKGKKWVRNRRLLTPAFHFDILRPYLMVYNQAADTLLDKMTRFSESGESFEVCKNISVCTLDVLLQCIFSYKTNCQELGDEHPYASTVKNLSTDVLARFFNPLLQSDFVYFNLTSRGKEHRKRCDYVHKVAEDIIAKRRLEVQVRGSEGQRVVEQKRYLDFLDILISVRDEDGVGLSDLEIRHEVDTFSFAGHDTTSSGLSWLIYALAKYPDHQKKVHEEIDSVMDTKDVIEWEDLPKLKYLTLCMKESMRMYPPVPVTIRILEKDTEVDGRVLKAGSQVNVQIYALHYHPDFWENENEFIPERFLPENTKDRDPFVYIPFSAGPRNCIGQNFATNEIKVLVARILRKFTIELEPDHKVYFSPELILKPSSTDIRIKLKPRKGQEQ